MSIDPEDAADLEETVALLQDPQALSDIREADAAYTAGDVVQGADAVRALAQAATASATGGDDAADGASSARRR